jgi:hypothetical protein
LHSPLNRIILCARFIVYLYVVVAGLKSGANLSKQIAKMQANRVP